MLWFNIIINKVFKLNFPSDSFQRSIIQPVRFYSELHESHARVRALKLLFGKNG